MKRSEKWTLGVVAAAVLLAGAPAWGQVRQIIQGNGMDANPQVGSGGSNNPVPGYVPINGNDIMSGNVEGLKYFHGNVPTQSAFTFGTNLPTSALGNFARLTAGTPLGTPNLGQTRPYYLPSSTVTGAGGSMVSAPYGGGFDNRYAPGTSLSPVTGRVDAGAAYAPNTRWDATGNFRTPTPQEQYGLTPQDTTPLQPSGLYGFRVAPDLGRPARVPREELGLPDATKGSIKDKAKVLSPENGGELPVRTDIGVGEERSADARVGRPVRAGVMGSVTGMEPEASLVGRTNPVRLEDTTNEVYQNLVGQLQGRTATTQATAGGIGGSTTQGGTVAIDIDPVTGQPRVGKGAIEYQSTDPSKPFYRPAPGTGEKKNLVKEQTETLQAGKEIEPIKTFIGKQDTPFNQYMKVAERQLKGGRYLDAAETYQDARVFSRENPLTKVGEAHAKMAAGMYVDSANLLRDHFERHPELLAVRYDLVTFLPEKRLDYLREDLAKLAHGVQTNPTASFLLSYLYYQLGDKAASKKELEYWQEQVRRDPWPGVLMRAWGEEK